MCKRVKRKQKPPLFLARALAESVALALAWSQARLRARAAAWGSPASPPLCFHPQFLLISDEIASPTPEEKQPKRLYLNESRSSKAHYLRPSFPPLLKQFHQPLARLRLVRSLMPGLSDLARVLAVRSPAGPSSQIRSLLGLVISGRLFPFLSNSPRETPRPLLTLGVTRGRPGWRWLM